MANFFLIDHSLRRSGGHHFDYASCVAQAASGLGFLTTIGVNRALNRSKNPAESLDRLGSVRRVFRDTTYQRDSYLAGLQHLTRSKSVLGLNPHESNRAKRCWNQLKSYRHNRRREQFVSRFAIDCERFFRPLLQTKDDHVLLTTVSELELMGLAAYLSKHPKTLQPNWHLQFHYNLFDGRTPEYDGQEQIRKSVRSACLAALSRLSHHSIHFYTTSETLVDQYNRLGVGEFEVLPYPISPEFAPVNGEQELLKFEQRDLANALQGSQSHRSSCRSKTFSIKNLPVSNADCERSFAARESEFDSETCEPTREFGQPIRITCPGELRREKGHVEYLQPLINKIWSPHLATGDVQVVVQRPARKWHSKKHKIELALPDANDSAVHQHNPIEHFSHPLSKPEYVELIKSTDVGLLFYDSRVYFSRRAGVLGELLSCGKPVIVPAGSWLADQIQEPIFRHVDELMKSSRSLRTIESADFGWGSKNVPMSGGVLSFDQANHPFDFTIERESDESAMVLEFDWHWPKEPGVYCRCDVTQKNAKGESIQSDSQVLGFRKSSRKVKAIFRMEPETCCLEFSLTNAFHDSTASIKRAKLSTYDLSTTSSGEFPVGSVGVIACDREDLANCVDEIVKHFDHYSATAKRFSKRWYSRHDPQETVKHLMLVSESGSGDVRRVA